jgi:hypothetical protein
MPLGLDAFGETPFGSFPGETASESETESMVASA